MNYFINPWASQQFKDYKKLREEFGIDEFNFSLPDAPAIFRRGVVFGHRGFDYIYNAIKNKKDFAVLSGLMPSGKMHLGHKMVIDQILYFQEKGGDIHIASADLEAYHTRGVSLEEGYRTTIEEYAKFYLALGVDYERAELYFQSKRREVKDLALKLSKKITVSELFSIYGFTGETSVGHILCPLVQIGDILHVQLDKFGGPRPTIVPVGVDQDPHIRLTRDMARKWRIYSFKDVNERIGIFLKGGIGNDAEKYLKLVAKYLNVNAEYNIPYRAMYIDKTEKITLDLALARLERDMGYYGFVPPSATYHRLITGLDGNKMSSSRPEYAIFLSDDLDLVRKKVKNALTGGRKFAEDQRKYGGNPDKCTVYELFVYHLAEDDNYLREIYEECRCGGRLCGQCKKEATEKLTEMLQRIQRGAKNITEEEIKKFVKEY